MLLVIDYSNLLIRHAAISAKRDPGGVSGVVYSLRQLERLAEEYQPDYLLVARDEQRANLHRRGVSQDYKAGRAALKSDLNIGEQFQLAWETLSKLGLAVHMAAGHEADDVIASAVSQFSGQSVVVSGDKDMLALADRSTIHLLRPGGSVSVDSAGCHKILGVNPDRVRDYKALVGDASDGISGVAGIGPKRAIELLERFDTVEKLYRADLSDLPTGIRNKLEAGKAAAEQSWQLAGMSEDLPLGDFERFRWPGRRDDLELNRWLDENRLEALRPRASSLFSDL